MLEVLEVLKVQKVVVVDWHFIFYLFEMFNQKRVVQYEVLFSFVFKGCFFLIRGFQEVITRV